MGIVKDLGRKAWRKFVVDGVSASGANKPDTIDIFPFVDYLDSSITGLAGGGELQGEWNAAAGTFPGAGTADGGQSWIVSTAGTVNGVKFRVGDRVIAVKDNPSTTVYATNWARLPAALDPVAQGSVTGGSANLILVATDSPISDTGGQLIAFTLTADNTSTDVKVRFNNNGVDRALKTASGGNPAIGTLTAGMPVIGRLTANGTIFLLLSDIVTAALLVAMQAAADRAEAAADSIDLSVYRYATASAAEAANVPSGVQRIEVLGYAETGDGWHRVLKKVVSEPAHPFKVRTADGAWWESTAPRKLFSMQGQSNMGWTSPFAWAPQPNVAMLNWSGVDTNVGDEFERLDPTLIGTGTSAANWYAKNHPDEDVFVVMTAFGGRTIDHWTGGIKNYAYSTDTTNAGMGPSYGDFRFNNANPALATSVFIHQADTTYATTGQTHAGGLGVAFSSTKTRISKASDPAIYVEFTFGAYSTVSNWYEVPITGVTKAGTLVDGDAIVIMSTPDAYACAKANLEAAFAIMGASKIDFLGFRQSEGNAVEPYEWPDEFDLFDSRMVADGLMDVTTPVILWGQTNEALSGVAAYGRMAYYIQRAAARKPNSRFYIDTAGMLPDDALWEDAGGLINIHNTGEGHYLAGIIGANRLMGRGGDYPSIPGVVTHPENKSVLWTKDGTVAAPAFSWLGDPDTGFYRAGADQIGFAAGGVQALLVEAGKLTIPGGQIKFPASQVASADANTLDDYEEGTFTPTLLFGGAAVGMTTSSAAGRYLKIGQLVYFTISIVLTAKGSSTGTATVGALPFTSMTGVSQVVSSIFAQAMASGWGDTHVAGAIGQASTALTLYKAATSTVSAWTEGSFTDTSVLQISGCYRASA